MYWYVLSIRTGMEEKVKKLLSKILDNDLFIPFIPLLKTVFKKQGVIKYEVKPLFPGYIFIESKLSQHEFTKEISDIISYIDNINHLLRYSDTEIALRETEKQLLLSLCDDKHCIESSIAIKEGSKIYIEEGPLKGKECIIKKVNRHKHLATIELNFMGEIRLVSVSLDVIEKIS
ncbi:antiterminator LoaP [Clostridium sp. BNL1100]|uniref:antiterminator LoaP n=1 Tax=Clostridium sp. BNL1100 TaxID=755731 RepID=UPI00024A7850|nr:antiterminator LoaP [Clostridium sp. BNL1100]AEY67379.1 transcription antiterminator [Clostridium sp. BNL1100]